MISSGTPSRGNAGCVRSPFAAVLFCTLGLALGLAPAPGIAAQTPATLTLDEAVRIAAQSPVTLTLDEAVRIALTRSPALAQAEAQHLRDASSGWDAWDRLLPSITFGTGLSQTSALQRTASDPITGGIVQLPDSLVAVRESFGTSASLGVSWTLFDGGRNLQAFRRSRADVRAADFGLDAARVRLAASVTLAYLDALEAHAREAAVRVEAERAAELERTAEARFQAGAVPEVDALQARLAAGDAAITLLEAEAAAYAARLELFEHLRLPAGAEVTLAEPDAVALGSLPPVAELRRLALDRSPELEVLHARIEAADRTAAAERWWFLPSVSVGAVWSRTEFGQTRDGLTLSPRNEGASYRLSLSWSPLQRPGGTVADRRRAEAGGIAARAELDLRRGTLARGVETALDRLERAQALGERSAVNLRLAERQLEQAQERYRLGAAPLVERLAAEALHAEAVRQTIVGRYAALRALAELERASGMSFLRSP